MRDNCRSKYWCFGAYYIHLFCQNSELLRISHVAWCIKCPSYCSGANNMTIWNSFRLTIVLGLNK